MKIGIFLNNSAGSIKENDYPPSRLKEIFKSLNVEAEVIEVEGEITNDSIRILTYKGVEAIVAAGGDGTVSTVASALSGMQIPLGIIPLGTLNHFAKDMNIPLQIEEAAKVIAKNKLLKVDTGEVNEKIFINNSSIGFYPKLVKHRDKEIETLGNKWVSMFKAFIIIFIKMPVMRIKIISDESHIHCTTPFVFIGNNEYEMSLFNLGSRLTISGGTLSLYYPIVTGRLSMLRFFFHALINKLNQQKDFKIEFVTGLTIESKKSVLEVSLDGEVYSLKTPLNYKIRPLDLTVIVP